jgi:Zn-dependent protease with chaperone function
MRYLLLASTAAFASFAVTAACGSALLAWASRAIPARLDGYAAASRAALLFRLRLLPAALAVVCAFGLALPIFVWFEPRDTDEPVSRTLVAIAGVGVLLLLRGAWRALAAWRATARTRRAWQAVGRLVPDRDAPLPVFAIDASFPIVAVVGVRRPALFVAERVLAECSRDELTAMIAHECAHVRAADNAKRFAARACPDLLGDASAMHRAWLAAAEEAADAEAAASRPNRAADLAQALIRVARLAPMAAPQLASAFYAGGGIERRVRRLVDPSGERNVPVRFSGPLVCAAAFTLVAAAIAAAPALHQIMEALVRILP